jgi:phage head maturation protease
VAFQCLPPIRRPTRPKRPEGVRHEPRVQLEPQRAAIAPLPAAAPWYTQICDGLALRDVDTKDAMGDVIPPTALDLTRFRANPCVLKDHHHDQPIGVVTKDWKTATGWWVTARIFDAGMNAAADQCWNEITSGGRRGLSIGFRGAGEPRVTSEGRQGTRWTKVEVIEVSSVCLPACPSCLLSSYKDAEHRCAPEAGRSDEVVLVLDDEAQAGRVSPLSPGVWIGGAAAGARALTERLRGGRR